MRLVDLTELIPDLIVDMRYAGHRNLAGKPLTTEDTPKMALAAAQALQAAAAVFAEQGLSVVVWDAYRSPELQAELHDRVGDEKYVLELSNHPLGLAVDITLARNQELLDMGTDHDDFSPRAHIDAEGLSDEQYDNRKLLQQVMDAHGFTVWPYEWWHFDYKQSQ